MDQPPSDSLRGQGHEPGKARRRALIVQTASAIISEQGEAGLTIRAIAAKAGLSPSTVYNLFGSKSDVIRAIYEDFVEDLATYFKAHASADALTLIFDMIDVSIDYCGRDPGFSRILLADVIHNANENYATGLWSSRSGELRRLLDSAVADGYLAPDMPVDRVATILTRLNKASTQEWVDGPLTIPEARTALGYSYFLVLRNFTTARGADVMFAIARRYDG